MSNLENRNKGSLEQLFSKGSEITFTLPDHRSCTIRERNGNDEDILSKVKYNQDGSAFDKYIKEIMVDLDGNGQPSMNQIMNMKVRSKYYILFKSRIQSLGSNIEFEHRFEDGSKLSFEEDLSKYDVDFSENLEIEDLEDIQPKPYPTGATEFFFFKDSSGREYRMRYLTSVMERSVLGKDQTELSINEKLRLRDFEVKVGDSYVGISNFKMINSSTMNEIRKELNKQDSEFLLMTEVKNKNMVEEVSLFMKEAFFFPQG